MELHSIVGRLPFLYILVCISHIFPKAEIVHTQGRVQLVLQYFLRPLLNSAHDLIIVNTGFSSHMWFMELSKHCPEKLSAEVAKGFSV